MTALARTPVMTWAKWQRALCVFLGRDGLQVRRIHASAIAAQMVDMPVSRHGTDEPFIRGPMRVRRFVTALDQYVAAWAGLVRKHPTLIGMLKRLQPLLEYRPRFSHTRNLALLAG
jgi:hypothetical protein